MKQICGQNLEEYIRGVRSVTDIVWGRIEGIPLEELVPSERISSGEERKNNIQEVKTRNGSFYDDLGRI